MSDIDNKYVYRKNPFTKKGIIRFFITLVSTYIVIGITFFLLFQTNLILSGSLSSKTVEAYEPQINENEVKALEANKLIEIDQEKLKRIPLNKLVVDYLNGSDYKSLKTIADSPFISKEGILYKLTQHYYRNAFYKWLMSYLNFFAVLAMLIYFLPPTFAMLLDNKIIAVKESIETAIYKKENAKQELAQTHQKIGKIDEIRKQNIEVAKRIGNQTAKDIITETENKIQHMDHLLDKYIRLEQKKFSALLKKTSVDLTIKNTLGSLRARKDISIHNKMVDKFIESLENQKS